MADVYYSLIEAAKLTQDPLRKGIIETIVNASDFFQYFTLMGVKGNAYKYNQEEALPGVAFRSVNEEYESTVGVINPAVEPLQIFGGLSKTDRAIVKTQGGVNSVRAIQDAQFAKAMALTLVEKFINGNSTDDPKEFDGLKARLTGDQVLDADSSASYALTLAKLDELIDAVVGGPSCLIMNKYSRRKVNALMRDAGQASETISGEFGRQIPAYAGVPIVVVETGPDGTDILPWTEDCLDTGSTASSIYAVKFGVNEYCCGLQCGGLDIGDQGKNNIWYQTLIEWIAGLALFHPKCAARLQGIEQG